jgi:hypothetical protein
MDRSLNEGWQSWYFEQHNTINALKQLDENGLIKSLDLSSTRIQSLAPLRDFDKLATLYLNRNNISLSELSYFPHLTHLEIQNNSLRSLVGIHALSKLEYLDISVNPIADYTPLFELKHLKTLVISKNISAAMVEKLHQQFPNLELKFS